MKKIFTLLTAFAVFQCNRGNSQAILNELYTDPGAGKHEFFELYNTSSAAASVNSYTIITFFDISGSKGFYVMDLPNLNVASRGYFVGSSALPFSFQGVSNSTASDFNWNSAAFTSNQGSLKKWVKGGLNLLDGNLFYDQAILPVNFNDFFYRRTGSGASYTVFLYINGQLVDTFIGGTGGNATITTEIVNMPNLFVDMAGASTDFTINFSGYASLNLEYCTNDAGSDNGYIRQSDGACATWIKSSASIQHTPQASNGTLSTSYTGTISVASAIARGNAASGSVVNYDVVAAPAASFPITMDVYTDLGSTYHSLDISDPFVATKTENVISDGAFYSTFFPYDANILIAVKTTAGCIDRILWIPNAILLSVKLVSFDAQRSGNMVSLDWRVTDNESASRFEIQKSYNGEDFIPVGSTTATTKKGDEHYSYTDPITSESRVSYRLVIFSTTGKVDYSRTIVFQPETRERKFALMNNPVQDKLTISYNNSDAGFVEIQIVDMKGSLVKKEKVNSQKGNNLFYVNLPGSMQKGIYVVNLSDGMNHYNSKFIIQ